MGSDNETVAEVLRVMRDAAHLDQSAIEDDNHLLSDWYYDDECQGWLSSFADRIEAAHRREIDSIKKALREACVELCRDCNNIEGHVDYKCRNDNGVCFVQQWRDIVEDKGETK